MAERIHSAEEILNIVRANPARLDALMANPLAELEKLKTEAVEKLKEYQNDILIYRIAVVALSSLALIAAIGSIILGFRGDPLPDGLVALGSAAVGGIVGLFAPSPTVK